MNSLSFEEIDQYEIFDNIVQNKYDRTYSNPKVLKRKNEPIKYIITCKKKKNPIPKAVRHQVWKKYIGNTLEGKCYVCNRIVYYDNFDAGHVVAEANGGEISVSNLRVTCKPCNTSCGTKNLDEFKKMLLK
jgi:5-methylcytosine-specific restriction endonuclease McrA